MSPPPDDALTAVTRRPRGMHPGFGFVLGIIIAAAPVATAYLAYRQARVEAGTDTQRVRDEAAAGYRTLVDPIGLVTTLVKAHEDRIAKLEGEMRECRERQTVAVPIPTLPSPGLVPLVRLRPLPPTLTEAAAAAK